MVGARVRERITLEFLRTCYPGFVALDNEILDAVLKVARSKYPTDLRKGKLRALTGFFHAYDLTKLLMTALETQPLEGGIQARRDAIRRRLKDLTSPVAGFMKTYPRPFTQVSTATPDAHEAPGADDVFMGGTALTQVFE